MLIVERMKVMNRMKRLLLILAVFLLSLSFAACSPMDKDYGESEVEKTESAPQKTLDTESDSDSSGPAIMSSDRVMSKYFDISLFDEENYADVYLGADFQIHAVYDDEELIMPVKIADIKEKGWTLSEGNNYNENSLVFAYETISAVIQNDAGLKLSIDFYNETRSSVTLSECDIVKCRIENDFYTNPQDYSAFDVNGINNQMAITDIIQTLGTPSHFYRVSENCYYLDYFITKEDRRDGITIYINPLDDSITAIEFSYYK